jgi:hypothetical protein
LRVFRGRRRFIRAVFLRFALRQRSPQAQNLPLGLPGYRVDISFHSQDHHGLSSGILPKYPATCGKNALDFLRFRALSIAFFYLKINNLKNSPAIVQNVNSTPHSP